MNSSFHKSIFFFIFISTAAFAQPPQSKDSLLHLIKTLPEDTAKLEVYYQYAFLLEDVNLDSAIGYYKKMEALSKKHNHVKGQLRYASGYSYVLNMQGKFDEGLTVNKEALRLAQEHHLERDMAIIHNNMANNFSFQGQYDSAIVHYLESATRFEKLKIHANYLPTIYQNIGEAFDGTEQHEKAVEYNLKAIRYAQQVNDSVTLITASVGIGNLLITLAMPDSALLYFQKAQQISQQIKNSRGLQIALTGIGNVYSRKSHKLPEALAAFKEAHSIAQKMNSVYDMAVALKGMADVLNKHKRFAEAEKYALEALAIQESSGNVVQLRELCVLLAAIYSGEGRYKQAYEYLGRHIVLTDSLVNDNVRKQTAELERKYQTAQKDKELAQKELRIQRAEDEVSRKHSQLLLVVGGLAFVLVVLFMLYRFYRQRQHAMQQQQEVIRLRSNLEGQQQERVRIAKEIHDDIGSGLTSLVFLTNSLFADEGNKKKKITDTAQQLVNQMNEIIWSLNSEQDTLEDFVIYTRHSISEMLDTAGIKYEFKIPTVTPQYQLTGAQRRHIFLVIKEAVHNSIKHASATCVTITMSFIDNLFISIEDNGNGISGDKTKGNGLKNMQYRIEQVGGDWKLSSTKPVKIELTVPLAV